MPSGYVTHIEKYDAVGKCDIARRRRGVSHVIAGGLTRSSVEDDASASLHRIARGNFASRST